MNAPPRFPFADADLCVKCGLCLPHCPTYRETGHEADSPRGRIALLQGIASEAIPYTPAAERHLDGCLGCRACESVCPAEVPYGQLIDRGRAWIAANRSKPVRGKRLLAGVFASRPLRVLLAAKLWLYQRSGIGHLLRGLRFFGAARIARLESLLPRVGWPRRLSAASPPAPDAPVLQVFAGCMGEWAEREAAEATLQLLRAAGFGIEIPRAQQCCGALHLHAGFPGVAQNLLQENLAAFKGSAPVIALASGCAAGLRDAVREAGSESAKLFASRVQDPFALLAGSDALRFDPLPRRVAVQLPCTQRLLPGSVRAMLAALKRVPQIEIVELAPARNCCGAAGSYFLTQPEMADRLLEATLDAIEHCGAGLVTSANIGCRLHIAAGLRRRNRVAEVLHPAVLLMRLLRS